MPELALAIELEAGYQRYCDTLAHAVSKWRWVNFAQPLEYWRWCTRTGG